MHYIVEDAMSLFDAAKKLSPQSSNNTLRSWIKQGRISVNEQVQTNPQFLLSKGQKVRLGMRTLKPEGRLKILFEDRDLVVVDKPRGLLSVASENPFEVSAHSLLKKRYFPHKVFVVHRLDQETTGVMLFARSESAFRTLKDALAKREIKRIYTAIIEGGLERKRGTWKSYLYEDESFVVRPTLDKEKGELAITHYEALKEGPLYSQLRIKLETGKKNQIRVHCQEAGHPIVGDRKYGSRCDPIKRMCLHAEQIEFEHPRTKKKILLSSPIPRSFERLVSQGPMSEEQKPKRSIRR